MSADVITLGGAIGEGVGTWGGRFVGGAIGELFGPEAVPFGAYVGGKVGGYAGRVAGAYLASHMVNASEKAETKLKEKAISRTCLTCKNCNDLQNEINNVRNKIAQRQQDLRGDYWNLYPYRPGPRPGYEDRGTWSGHQEQFENLQDRLRHLLDDAATANCDIDEGDARKKSTEETPSKPARKPSDYIEPDPRGINGPKS